tara:strand:+ start:1020 stop:1178 length:159 start_codon:yes stop_codon:yes gene_type:complete
MRFKFTHINPVKIATTIVLFWGWYTGEVENFTAVLILLLLIDFKIHDTFEVE